MGVESGLSGLQVLIIGTSGMLTMAFSIVLFIYLYQRKLIRKKLENQQIVDLLQQEETKSRHALMEGQDRERKRIATELHDNLGSILTSLNMFADALAEKIEPDEIIKIATKISETSKIANEEVRKISHRLDAGMLQHFGLEAAVFSLMEAIEAAKKIEISCELHINDPIDGTIGQEIYRMIQELVNNTLKHSKCSRIRLDINSIQNDFTLIFQDNGVGFDIDKVKRGMGITNLETRVNKLGGDLTVESKPNKGSTFTIEIPIS